MSVEIILDKIKNGVYGKDVRQAIHDGIEKVYEDAGKSGNANMEVERARGTFDSLEKRLSETDDVLEDKATKKALDAIASGNPKPYTNLLAIQTAFPNGDTKSYLSLADGNWYYWNGTAWISGGVYQSTVLPDSISFKATNLIKNGDFSNLLTGWTAQGGVGSVSANTHTLTGNGTLSQIGAYTAVNHRYTGKTGHKIYTRARMRVNYEGATTLRLYVSDGTTIINVKLLTSPLLNTWYNLSGIVELPSSFEGKDVRHFFLAENSGGAEVTNGKATQLFRPLAIDLTEIFGKGYEPSSETMDQLLEIYPNSWFDGTRDILGIKQYIQTLSEKIKELEKPVVETREKNSYELFDDFSTSTWSVEDSSNATITKEKRKNLTGTESLKVNVINSNSIARNIDRKIDSLLTTKTKQMMLKLYVENPQDLFSISVYFGNEQDIWGNYCKMTINGYGDGSEPVSGGLLRKGWNFVSIVPSEMTYTNSFDWNKAVKRIRLAVTPKNDNPVTVIFDSFWVNGNGTPKIVFTFDDAWKTVYENAYPVMKANNIVGTTYVIGQYVDNPNNPISPDFCTLNQLKELQANGWIHGNHTWQHNYFSGGGHTPSSYLALIDQNRDWMVEKGIGAGSLHFCYPNGEYSQGVLTLLKAKGYKSARAAKPRGAHPIEIDDRYQIFSRNFSTNVTLETAKKWVDQCIESGGTTFFQFHQIPIDDTTSNGNENPYISWSKSKFEALISYIAQKEMAENCLTHDEWFNWIEREKLINP